MNLWRKLFPRSDEGLLRENDRLRILLANAELERDLLARTVVMLEKNIEGCTAAVIDAARLTGVLPPGTPPADGQGTRQPQYPHHANGARR